MSIFLPLTLIKNYHTQTLIINLNTNINIALNISNVVFIYIYIHTHTHTHTHTFMSFQRGTHTHTHTLTITKIFVRIAHSYDGYNLCSLLILIAHSLHTRLVSHLHYLGFLFYFINLRFVLCFHCSVIWIWILNKFASRRLWEEKMICCFSHLFCCV